MPTRLPNLLHTLLFLALTFFSFLLSEALLLALFSRHSPSLLASLANQQLQLAASALTYVVALLAARFTFPLLWHRPFLTGIHWNPQAARPRLILFGLLLGFLTQAAETRLTLPKHLPIEDLLLNPRLIWSLTLFGTLLAPLFEEIVFRGLLLPALALAVDWLRLPRSLEAHTLWRAADTFSRPALILASILTSLLFALLHAPQLGYTWSALALLAIVSLVLCVVRLRTHSVAASTLVHAAYNLSVFLTLFVASSGFRHFDAVSQ